MTPNPEAARAPKSGGDWWRDVKFGLLRIPQGPVITRTAASAMATGIRSLIGSDIGVAITGVAGPDEEEGQPRIPASDVRPKGGQAVRSRTGWWDFDQRTSPAGRPRGWLRIGVLASVGRRVDCRDAALLRRRRQPQPTSKGGTGCMERRANSRGLVVSHKLGADVSWSAQRKWGPAIRRAPRDEIEPDLEPPFATRVRARPGALLGSLAATVVPRP